jgi:hypothetical protein
MNTLQIATWQFLLLRRIPGVSISIFKEDDQHNRGGISHCFHMIVMQGIKTREKWLQAVLSDLYQEVPSN